MDAISRLCTGNYFIANTIHCVEKKRAIFLKICGHDTYCLACDLLFPRAPDKVSLTEILQVLLYHLYMPESQSSLNVLGSTDENSVMKSLLWCILFNYWNYQSIVCLGIL